MILELDPKNLELMEHLELTDGDTFPSAYQVDSGIALKMALDALFQISLSMEIPAPIFDRFVEDLKLEYLKEVNERNG